VTLWVAELAPAARSAKALVLVAEDNGTNQIVIAKMVSRIGFACKVADNGKIALAMLERPGYELLLTDFNMPEMNGFEFTKVIRDQVTGTEKK